MVVQPAPFPALGYDCITTMDAARASALKAAGMSFAVRYLGSITSSEVAVILGAGLALSVVTYGQGSNWSPGADPKTAGATAGQNDLNHLAAAGIPKGATVWIDLEGVYSGTTAAELADWVNERGAVLRSAGYDPGLYVGAGSIFNSAQLYALVSIDRYWRSLSNVPTPTCGWSLLQLYKTITLAGTEIDVDCVQYDWQERLPMFIFAGP